MFRVVWLVALLLPIAVAVFGLRWALKDFLLDRFEWRSREGSRPDTRRLRGYGDSPEKEFFV